VIGFCGNDGKSSDSLTSRNFLIADKPCSSHEGMEFVCSPILEGLQGNGICR
jgi:hypothetical protein